MLYLVNEFGAGVMEGGDKVMGEPLEFSFVTDVDFSSICHTHGIEGAPPMHTQWSSLRQLFGRFAAQNILIHVVHVISSKKFYFNG